MAKTRTSSNGKPATVMGAFRKLLLAHPQLIKRRSNARVIELYLRGFPGRNELSQKEKGALANVKGHLRKQRRGRKKADGLDGADVAPRAVKLKAADLMTLEFSIDDCYALARRLDPVGLDNVVQLLRKARNEIIIKQ